MTPVNTSITPTHDEIALHAFLIWEKDGRQPGREQAYWFQAESQLRQQLTERAASISTCIWPPPTAAAPAFTRARAITSAAPKRAKLANASRTRSVKPPARAKAAPRKVANSAPVGRPLARS